MGTGEIYLDFAAIMFTVFCGAFVYLVLYLHKEGKREGFPLRHDGPVDTYSTGVGAFRIQKLQTGTRSGRAHGSRTHA